jgi:hypothetical protein
MTPQTQIDLGKINYSPELLATVPADIARRYEVLPVSRTDGTLCVAVRTPSIPVDRFEHLRSLLGVEELNVQFADPWVLGYHIYKHYGGGAEAENDG